MTSMAYGECAGKCVSTLSRAEHLAHYPLGQSEYFVLSEMEESRQEFISGVPATWTDGALLRCRLMSQEWRALRCCRRS